MKFHPSNLHDFLGWMTAQREGLPIFLDSYPFEELIRTESEDAPVFVDIGGANGHQSLAVLERFPNLSGRIVLQELPHVIDQLHGKLNPGIELMKQDIFDPQSIRGARAYYMRNMLHAWPDETCKQILRNTASAMTDKSVLLIDEMVLPEMGTPPRAAQLDMAMMVCAAAKERTAAQWKELLSDAGMKIDRIWKYTEECQDCVIVALPK
jgi:hypothetical protein